MDFLIQLVQKLLNLDNMTILIIGDASFHMTFIDLYTIQKYILDIKIFVIVNQNQNMVRCWEKLFYDVRVTANKNYKPDLFTKTFS